MRMICIANFLLIVDVLHDDVDIMKLYYNVKNA